MQVVSNITFPSATAASSVKTPKKAPESISAQQLSPQKTVSKASDLWQSGSFSAGDVIDMVNPLQHLPVISTIYRKLTGDEIGAGPRMIGGALFGALLGNWVSGLASAMANAFSTRGTGKDIGQHMMDFAQSTITPASQPEKTAIAATYTSNMVAQGFHSHPAAPSAAAAPVQVANHPSQPAATMPSGETVAAATSAVPSPAHPLQTAIGQYQQQVILDDFRKESHYWG